MRYGSFGMMGPGWGLIMILVVLVLVFFGIWAFLRFVQHSGYITAPNTGSSRAIEILNERYAKGEIQDDEYNKKKAELKNR